MNHQDLTSSIITPINSLALKGFASVVIVLHHYVQYTAIGRSNLCTEFLGSVCGYIAVALFFFLSGYGLMESEKRRKLSVGAFLKRRLSRVYVPFVITNVLIIMVLWGIGHYEATVGNIMAHTLGLRLIDSVTWFVPVTLLFYLFVLLLSGVQERWHKACGMAGLGVAYIVIGMLVGVPFYAFVSSPAFPLGYIASLYSHEICQTIQGAVRAVMLVVCAVAFALLSWTMMGHIAVQGHLLHAVIGANNIALVGIVVLTFAGKDYKWLRCKWLGDISYEIYLCHAKVFMVYIALTGTFATFHPLWLLGILPLAYALSVVDRACSQRLR